jgi:hypothetical protein
MDVKTIVARLNEAGQHELASEVALAALEAGSVSIAPTGPAAPAAPPDPGRTIGYTQLRGMTLGEMTALRLEENAVYERSIRALDTDPEVHRNRQSVGG